MTLFSVVVLGMAVADLGLFVHGRVKPELRQMPSHAKVLPMPSAALLGANRGPIGASHDLVMAGLLEEATSEGLALTLAPVLWPL